MTRRLSDETIAARMVELRNVRSLYTLAKKRIGIQDALIATQKERIAGLEEQVTLLRTLVDTQNIRIAELETMVFGKKRRPPSGTVVPELPLAAPFPPRNAASYHRPLPSDGAVTSVEAVTLPEHCACGGSFREVTTHVRYEEDIPLPELTPRYQAHLVTKYVITRGVCSGCSRTTVGRDIGGAKVTLGPNVRLLVTDLVARMGLSYAQVSQLLLGLYGLAVSDGEIANLLQAQHRQWLSVYNQLGDSIRAAPVVHVDETPWPIAAVQGGYAWVLANGRSPDVCYALAQSRGVLHAKQLFGQDTKCPFQGIRISDDYGAYRSAGLPGVQQLCWAHLFRAIRDLRSNSELPQPQERHVAAWYGGFAAIYKDLRLYLGEPYDAVVRETQAAELWQRIRQLAAQPAPSEGEPAKLTRLKAQLLRAGKDKLFVCLSADTPCDNNRAERDLRQLVCKRKRSFGSKTEKGAKALATVLSLCTTLWRRAQATGNPVGYYNSLAAIAG